ncbi:flavin-containing monooxygenase [Mycobacterium marseillense]|uniref:Monooxygenase n=1 Tax=Mycobacterium marseillense TaxID=701042 RepID=A0ABN5ZVD9_9MYCO|nr:NAD(P)/FAD-dependent oxidoreductase [Mycobacterium marseillense]MCV7406361.1 NAD(P)/FAD-dependent oxidoreductase [Mycobacterium marseillense]ORA89556.1 monooxygenase [Mycobacterium marseillense]BBY12559.1 monooxygenase [Mycobacterium marseillense]
MVAKIDAEQLGFDPDFLRERYRAERDKRLRTDGIQQYIEPTGDFSRYVDDPYVERVTARAPLTDQVDALIVGGGIGGLLAAARLREAGLERIRVVDKAGDFGGTWYWNRYPGARCDIESYIYLPLLEETGYIPTEKYATGPEILAYLQSIGQHYKLYEDACFQTEVSEIRWDEADTRWVVTTNRNDAMRARFVVMSSGPLNRPKLPAVPGISKYRGHTFHTSRWDYDYTGGSPEGGLERLVGKRIGVIGTGATAVQIVPHLAESAGHLYVFQRTPSSISERRNAPTDSTWAASLQPGWHRQRMENFNALVSGLPQEADLVGDGWTDMMRKVGGFLTGTPGADVDMAAVAAAVELADFQKMEELRARIDDIVEDSATAEALKPYYRMFCKRPCFSDDYLQAFNRPNVTLVDTDGQGVERFTERGMCVKDVEYELDCVVFATGFEVGTSPIKRACLEVIGRDKVRISEKWADGFSTLHGLHSHGFPNMFHLGVTQTGLTVNVPHMLAEQTGHLAHIVKEALRTGATYIEANADAEAEWVATINRLQFLNEGFLSECTPGYYNQEGMPRGGHSLLAGQYGEGPVAFFALLDQWRKDGHFAGMTIR